jgi:ATP-binding cassette subfamily F protein 3
VLVSHDRHLIERTVDQLWLVKGGRVEAFFGDMDDYYQSLAEARQQARSRRRLADKESATKRDRREERKQSAMARARLAPLKKRAGDAEAALQACQEKKDAVDAALASPDTYAGDSSQIEKLVKTQRALEAEIESLEAAWLEAEAALEAALGPEEDGPESG